MSETREEGSREPDVTIFDVYPAGWWHVRPAERTAAVGWARMRQRRRLRRRARRARRAKLKETP